MPGEQHVNLCSPAAVAELLQRRGIKPSKALGQNFLVDRNILRAIAEAAGLDAAHPENNAGTRVLEIGPGLGVLTETLLDCGADVTSVEKDERLWPILEERFAGNPRFELVRGDALELDYAEFPASRGISRIVANLPYSVGTRVVVDAARCARPPESMTLLLQKEVCMRFTAPPRSPDRGAVSVWLQRRYDVAKVRDVPPGCFVPRPDVTSGIVTLRMHGRFPMPHDAARDFDELVKRAFLHRRKQLCVSLRGECAPETVKAALERAGASPTARAEELSVEQWLVFHAAVRGA